ncbi:hypothetical protein GO986_12370 [Deinococcus sp. HMF7620]|uniref:Uncharacterized protein n=1 Tax=Deinococcus arboris TaxID=2682977 RepID=A0A7C9LRQ7_9DEIO|nr:hypothetical protein [Deinococcus arboris]MVN87561.1 hypothetical protein [Deinococcus arboris]
MSQVAVDGVGDPLTITGSQADQTVVGETLECESDIRRVAQSSQVSVAG